MKECCKKQKRTAPSLQVRSTWWFCSEMSDFDVCRGENSSNTRSGKEKKRKGWGQKDREPESHFRGGVQPHFFPSTKSGKKTSLDSLQTEIERATLFYFWVEYLPTPLDPCRTCFVPFSKQVGVGMKGQAFPDFFILRLKQGKVCHRNGSSGRRRSFLERLKVMT